MQGDKLQRNLLSNFFSARNLPKYRAEDIQDENWAENKLFFSSQSCGHFRLAQKFKKLIFKTKLYRVMKTFAERFGLRVTEEQFN